MQLLFFFCFWHECNFQLSLHSPTSVGSLQGGGFGGGEVCVDGEDGGDGTFEGDELGDRGRKASRGAYMCMGMDMHMHMCMSTCHVHVMHMHICMCMCM